MSNAVAVVVVVPFVHLCRLAPPLVPPPVGWPRDDRAHDDDAGVGSVLIVDDVVQFRRDVAEDDGAESSIHDDDTEADDVRTDARNGAADDGASEATHSDAALGDDDGAPHAIPI